MKTLIKIVIALILMFFTMFKTVAQDVTQSYKDSLEIVVRKYYDLNLKTFRPTSTISDIDSIFEYFTEDFTYIHPKYGGIYSRKDLYNGYVRNQKNGDYIGRISAIKIQNIIVGLNVVVVQRIYVLNDNGSITEGEPQVTLFEFKKSRISKIFEYW
ncbi:nuclear transport factor 2 family protein [Aquimarina sp. BL5]|uniref:nuclear transport factor 2 family protein n=1 Tax=Aquimarina sp. BL5 TaxID=1714860 RepID=UPI001F28CBDA|nr:nuclear transport factor 2 family protein [Aquimarina sp. BL5]